MKAVENTGASIGLKCVDGIVLAAEKIVLSKLLTPNANKRIQSADVHIGITSSGQAPDCRQLVNRARDEARDFRSNYRFPMTGKILANRMGQFMQAYTLYGSVRPFGSCLIVGVVDRDGPSLWMLQPSGNYNGYNGCAAGKGSQVAKTEIEKLNFSTLTCKEAVKQASRIIHIARDDTKDKDFELEISWICPESKNQHKFVPKEVLEEALAFGKSALDEAMDED